MHFFSCTFCTHSSERTLQKKKELELIKEHNKKIKKELKKLEARWNKLVGERHARERGTSFRKIHEAS